MRNKSREVLVDNCPVVCEDLSGTKYCCVENSDCCDKTCCTENEQCCRRFNPTEQLTGDVHGNEADNKKPLEEIISDQITVWELAVGQGDCTYIICPNNDLVILNMGSSSLSPYILNQTDVRKIFVNHLKSYPSSKFRIIVDPDKDHFNYVQEVLTGLESSVDYFILMGLYHQYVGSFNTWLIRNFLDRIFTIKGSPCYGNTDCIIGPFGKDSPVITPNFCNNDLVKFTILAANFGDNLNNPNSAVIKMQYGDISILFPGDSSSDDELMEIIVHYDVKGTKELNATIYKMVHYGFASDGDSYNFLYRIRPEAAFTNQVWPTSSNYGFPRCTVVNHLVFLGIANDSTAYPFVCGNYHQKPTIYSQWKNEIYETCRELNSMCYNIKIQLDQNNYKIDYVPLDKPVVKSSDEELNV